MKILRITANGLPLFKRGIVYMFLYAVTSL